MFIDQEDGRIEKGLQKGVYQHLGAKNVKLAFTTTDQVIEELIDIFSVSLMI